MKRTLWILAGLALLVAISWAGLELTGATLPSDWLARLKLPLLGASKQESTVPTTTVKRGDLTFSVNARGDLQGGSSESLNAPLIRGDLVLTSLCQQGDLVKAGDVVAQFDTTEQELNLREAQADLAEAEQKLVQAQADSQAQEEENRYALSQAKTALTLAELEERRNPFVGKIAAEQNTLIAEAAREKLDELTRDLANRQATSKAGIAIQDAARAKAQAAADTARQNIEMMTLRARTGGYCSVQLNQGGINYYYMGMVFPIYQVGDTARAGMAVAQIIDMQGWEVRTNISELDRGHIVVGQKAEISVVAQPGRVFHGAVRSLGNTTGVPWDREFECRLSLDDPSPQLRPGMTANIVITTDTLSNALWLPAQSLFESDGRAFVYLRTAAGFVPHDVKLVRRGESRVVVTGLHEGQEVALANPGQQSQKQAAPGSATQAIPK